MSIDMTGWQRLSAVGRDKQLSQLPRGGAPKGVQFAIKIKKAQWIDGQYVLDVTVRTLDLSLILAGTVWKLWPSMLPEELQEALDCDDADGVWWMLETEVNPKSKTNRTKFFLLDTQQGLDASGPPKPAAAEEASLSMTAPRQTDGAASRIGSEWGQPRAGGDDLEPSLGHESLVEPPATIPPPGMGNDCPPGLGENKPPAAYPLTCINPGYQQVGCDVLCGKCSMEDWATVQETEPAASPLTTFVNEALVAEGIALPTTCPHPPDRVALRPANLASEKHPEGFYCMDCGERVG